jgi:hypothetical protein
MAGLAGLRGPRPCPTTLRRTGRASRRFGRTLARLAAIVLAVAWAGGGASAQAAQEIRFKVINGKLCAKCTLRCGTRAIPANVVLDLGMRAPLVVHEKTAKLLGLGGDATAQVQFENVTFADLRAASARLPQLDELTNLYSTELEEIPAVAMVGLPAFANYSPQLEIDQGVLRLMAPAEPRQVKPAATQPAARTKGAEGVEVKTATVPFEEKGYGCFLAGAAPDGFALRVLFSTSGYDTIIDSNTADLAGSPGGDLDQLHIGGLNIARYVALRPEDLTETPLPHPDVILGTGLLSHFRVTIDLVNHLIEFEQTLAPQFPKEERAYFVARSKGDADAIEAFVKANGLSRLALEAADKLLALRLDEYPPVRDAIARAIRYRAESAPQDRRAGTMVDLADTLIDGKRDDRYDLAGEALKVGMEFAPVALNGRTVHDLRARMGLIALHRNDLKQARRDLLSAAFGIPKDAYVNLWLGELYEKSGQLTRAWSRYVQSALSEKAPPEAMAGLDRLNRSATFRASFTMADAEQLLEGRVSEFHPTVKYGEAPASQASSVPATRAANAGEGNEQGSRRGAEAQRDGGKSPAMPRGHVRLVELFACVDHPLTQGPELAFDGLREYFQGDADTAAATLPDIAFIEYHLAAPETDPLICDASKVRATFYDVKAAPAVYFDGGNANTDAGDERAVGKLFDAYRIASLAEPKAAPAWRLRGHASLAGNEISGAVELSGPAGAEGLRLHVLLCDKTVMVPGANKLLLHRMVARASLSPAGGFAVSSSAGERRFDIHANTAKIGEGLEQAIAALEKEREVKFLMRPTYVDGGACTIVAILQENGSKQVMTACAFDIIAGNKRVSDAVFGPRGASRVAWVSTLTRGALWSAASPRPRGLGETAPQNTGMSTYPCHPRPVRTREVAVFEGRP